MSNSVEIFQNTLLKLAVRSGSDSDRKNVILDVGELGYTTDTKRLYIGDGVTAGGVLAGNVVIGDVSDFSAISLTPPAVGDLIYVTGNSTLYRYISGTPTLQASWSAVGRLYSSEDSTIVVTTDKLKVGTLSAGNFSNDAVASNIHINGSGRIALSAGIAIDTIKPLNNTFVSLPSSLRVGLSTYNFPTTGGQPINSFLQSDGNGNLSWRSVTTLLTAASATLIPGKGVTLSVNGVQSTQALLLTSGNVQFDTIFSPTHFVEFDQTGQISRQVNVSNVAQVTYSALSVLANVPPGSLVDGKTVQLADNPFRNGQQANASGAWLINLSTSVIPSSSIVEVKIKNATMRYTPTTNNFVSPDLNSRYFFYGTPPSTQLYVYTYASRIIQTGDNGERNSWSAPILTPGFDDPSTRISVTVYG